MSFVLTKTANGEFEKREMDLNADNMRNFIGGWLETVRVTSGYDKPIILWLDEEGKLKADNEVNVVLLHNRKPYDFVVGNIIITSVDEEGNTIGLTDEQITEVYGRCRFGVNKNGESLYAIEVD